MLTGNVLLIFFLFFWGPCSHTYIEEEGDRQKEEAGISLAQRLNTWKQLSSKPASSTSKAH